MIFLIKKSVLDQDNELNKSLDRSKLVRKQVTDKNGHRRTVWVRPDENKTNKRPGRIEKTDLELDREYMTAIKVGDTAKVQQMVLDRAAKMGFKDAIPEQGNGYKVRVTAPPKKTRTCYKCFFVDENGRPSALFVDNNAALPTNVWLNANDTYHFMADNGSYYVPTMGNANNKDAGKTGVSIAIPDDKTRNELIERGYLPKGSKAGTITCVAYRPGWHGGDLPFFPQGGRAGNPEFLLNGKKNKKYDPNKTETNYDNVHRWNQVIFEIEVNADHDYTEEARNQPKARNKDGSINERKADLQYMPEGGMYEYTTNATVKALTGGKGNWFITDSIKIKRALTEKECNEKLIAAGLPVQEWEKKPDMNDISDKLNLAEMSLDKLGYTGTELSAARKTLAPITYDDNGQIIPLSKRFDKNSDDIRKSIPVNPWRAAFNLP